jgi:5-methylcytosine-specific restriction endonuclease McrA
VKSGDIAEMYDQAIKELIKKLERVRFGACERPRSRPARTKAGSRHIPTHVRRAVWHRDGGQCTFKSESGRRCEARRELEFDHETEFARGGEATVGNLRLRCRGHNQHAAEQTFGAGFIQAKRDAAKAAAQLRKAERDKRAEARARAKAAKERARAEKVERAEQARLRPHELEVLPYLRKLGCRDAESREAAAMCRDMADATLEDRVKRALSMFGARCGRKVLPVSPAVAEAPRPEVAPMAS